MPRFFFDVYDGQSEHDDKGTELPSVEEARQEAIRLAGAILREEAYHEGFGNWRMEVMNEDGEICFGLSFDVFESALARSNKASRFPPSPSET